jgi:hypothetical protein
MSNKLDALALDQLFCTARTRNAWTDRPVTEQQLRELSARALGLDCSPMSGFNNEAVDSEFFANTRIKSNFICSIGHGSDQNLFPRNPRLTFEESGRFA